MPILNLEMESRGLLTVDCFAAGLLIEPLYHFEIVLYQGTRKDRSKRMVSPKDFMERE